MYSAEQDPHTRPGVTDLYAPDVVQGKDAAITSTTRCPAQRRSICTAKALRICCKSVLKRCNPRFRDIFPQKNSRFLWAANKAKPPRICIAICNTMCYTET